MTTLSLIPYNQHQTPIQLLALKYVSLCPISSQDWESASMGFSQYDNLPRRFSDFLIAQVAAKVAEKVEQNIWQGATANAGEFNGFQALLLADSDVVDVSGTTLSASNIIAELGKVVNAIPSGVYNKEDLKIYIPTSAAKFYIQAQAALGYRELYHVGKTDMNFQGIPLFTAPGLGADKMGAAESSNLFFGTGLLNDWQEVKLIDMADIDEFDPIFEGFKEMDWTNVGVA